MYKYSDYHGNLCTYIVFIKYYKKLKTPDFFIAKSHPRMITFTKNRIVIGASVRGRTDKQTH